MTIKHVKKASSLGLRDFLFTPLFGLNDGFGFGGYEIYLAFRVSSSSL
jgi:hypothetical protein